MMGKLKNYISEHTVYFYAIIVVLLFSVWGILSPNSLNSQAGKAFDFAILKFGWFYLLSVSIFLVFCLYLLFSPYGHIRLGKDDAKPQYSYLSWFAMLFSAGMAIGLVFWGVAEPLSHYAAPPDGIQAGSEAARIFSFRMSFFHWGFHAWANYALFALAIAYFQLRKGYPGLVSSIFIPIIGEARARGPIGKIIDIIAVFATVAGISTDLGFGTLQLNSGLNFLYGVPINLSVQITIIVVITVCFMISAVKGLDKGIKRLSDINLFLVVVLMALVMIVGPQKDIIMNLIQGFSSYIRHIAVDSFPIHRLMDDKAWMGSWTIFYWAWWIAWTPFVGTFIARISWGRTIREFIAGVLLVPTIGSVIWFSIFGSLGMNGSLETINGAIASIPTALFTVVSHYPLSGLISLLTIVLIVLFFVTSADSSTFVLGILTSKGNPNPTTKRKLIWGVLQSAIAISLLMAGGLGVIQTASIVAALPFTIVMLASIYALLKSLRHEGIQVEEVISENIEIN
jgi:glycine betaine transporter